MTSSSLTNHSYPALHMINRRNDQIGNLFQFDKSALVRTAKLFLREELWKAVDLTVLTKSASAYISYGLPEENLTESEGISSLRTSFHGVEKNVHGWSTIRILTVSNKGWGLTGLICADSERSDAWIMGFDNGIDLEPWCGRFNLIYEAGWGDTAIMKRDFMLLRLKGELGCSY